MCIFNAENINNVVFFPVKIINTCQYLFIVISEGVIVKSCNTEVCFYFLIPYFSHFSYLGLLKFDYKIFHKGIINLSNGGLGQVYNRLTECFVNISHKYLQQYGFLLV